MNVTSMKDGKIDYRGHEIVPVRYGDGSHYNWIVEIDGKSHHFCGVQSRDFAIQCAKEIIDEAQHKPPNP